MNRVEHILLDVAAGAACGMTLPEKESHSDMPNETSALVPFEETSALDLQITQTLSRLLEQSGADLCILFQREAGTQQVGIQQHQSLRAFQPSHRDALHESPVNDVIEEKKILLENYVSAKVTKFQNLLQLVQFESCMGVSVESGHEDDHSLFLFHMRPNQFSETDVEQTIAAATYLSAILDRISLNERIRFLDKMMLSGQLASGFAHEIYNQLSALNLQVRNLVGLVGKIDSDPQRNTSNAAQQEWADMPSMVSDLSDVTADLVETATSFRLSLQSGRKGIVTIQRLLEDARSILQATAARNSVTITINPIPENANIEVDTDVGQHIFLNILLNGVQHVAAMNKRRGEIEVTASYDEKSDLPVKIRFTDDGPGIHARLWERVFHPGFSTREDGTGWGLHIVRTLARSIGGHVSVEKSHIQVETTFLVELPVS